jgi:hypothetical protein
VNVESGNFDVAVAAIFLYVPAQDYVGRFPMTFKEHPQRQEEGQLHPG